MVVHVLIPDCEEGAYLKINDEFLTTEKLLYWCYQIANGMAYLAARKVHNYITVNVHII